MSKNALPIAVIYRRISDVQLPSRASVKREPRSCPTKNHVANLTPLRFRRYFNNDYSRVTSDRILKRNMNVAGVSRHNLERQVVPSAPCVVDFEVIVVARKDRTIWQIAKRSAQLVRPRRC